MKLLSTAAIGALLLSACAPFEHGHYAADVSYGGSAPVHHGGYEDPYYPRAVAESHAGPVYSEPAYSVPATYSTPVEIAPPPLPVVQASYVDPLPYSPPVVHQYEPVAQVSYPEPPHHVRPHRRHHDVPPPVYVEPATYVEPAPYVEPPRYVEAPRYVEPPRYVEAAPYVEPIHHGYEVAHHAPPPPPIHYAPEVTTVPIAKPIHRRYVAEAAPIVEQPPIYESAPPVVVATSVNTPPERYEAETVYAPPSVVDAAPVYMRGAPQYANQPFPEPSYGAPHGFGAPGGFSPTPYPAPPLPNYGYQQPQGFGFPAPPPGFGGGFYGAPLAASSGRFPPFGGGYGNRGCVVSCPGGASVF